jgi:hypothetical protein
MCWTAESRWRHLCLYEHYSFHTARYIIGSIWRPHFCYQTWCPINMLCCEVWLLQLLSQVRCWYISYIVLVSSNYVVCMLPVHEAKFRPRSLFTEFVPRLATTAIVSLYWRHCVETTVFWVLTLRSLVKPRRWRQQVSPKPFCLSTILLQVTSQKLSTSTFMALCTSAERVCVCVCVCVCVVNPDPEVRSNGAMRKNRVSFC